MSDDWNEHDDGKEPEPLEPFLPDPETWATPDELHIIRETESMLDALPDEVREPSEDARWQLLEAAIHAERLASMLHSKAKARRDCLRAIVCPEISDRDWKKVLGPKVPMEKRMHELRLLAATLGEKSALGGVARGFLRSRVSRDE